MGRRPSADPFEEIDPDAHHAKGEKVEHEECYPRLVLPPEEGEACDHEDPKQPTLDQKKPDSFQITADGRTLRPWQRPSKTDDACSAQPQGLFPIATSLRHGLSRFCLNAEHSLWAWPLGADSSIVSRIEVDMTMKIATALAVVTALSTALGVLITVLAVSLMTTYI